MAMIGILADGATILGCGHSVFMVSSAAIRAPMIRSQPGIAISAQAVAMRDLAEPDLLEPAPAAMEAAPVAVVLAAMATEAATRTAAATGTVAAMETVAAAGTAAAAETVAATGTAAVGTEQWAGRV